jgi:hypothetical protein
VKNLRRAENLQLRLQFFEARHVRVVITDKTLCQASLSTACAAIPPAHRLPVAHAQKCHNRIGKSAFHRYPNGVIVHYICSSDRTRCPVTGKVFSRPKYPEDPSANVTER